MNLCAFCTVYRVEMVLRATQHIAVSSTAAKERQFCLKYSTTSYLQVSQTKCYIQEDMAPTFSEGTEHQTSQAQKKKALEFWFSLP